VEFEWDADKATANRKKHGVDFADAVTVLYDELALTVLDDSDHEERFVTVGTDALGRILIVVYVLRGDVLRMISARKATPLERRQYEEER